MNNKRLPTSEKLSPICRKIRTANVCQMWQALLRLHPNEQRFQFRGIKVHLLKPSSLQSAYTRACSTASVLSVKCWSWSLTSLSVLHAEACVCVCTCGTPPVSFERRLKNCPSVWNSTTASCGESIPEATIFVWFISNHTFTLYIYLTYVAGKAFVLLHEAFIFLVNFEDLANSICGGFSLKGLTVLQLKVSVHYQISEVGSANLVMCRQGRIINKRVYFVWVLLLLV